MTVVTALRIGPIPSPPRKRSRHAVALSRASFALATATMQLEASGSASELVHKTLPGVNQRSKNRTGSMCRSEGAEAG